MLLVILQPLLIQMYRNLCLVIGINFLEYVRERLVTTVAYSNNCTL